jgi:RecQ family ATP-dependent DNA helicase
VSRDVLLACLRDHWGCSDFLSGQEDAVRAVLSGQDVSVVMATGSGKSLCYQLPAVALRRQDAAAQRKATTIVVSPLISLMQDQVLSLSKMGIAACFLGSTQQNDAVYRQMLDGQFALVYMTPELATAWSGLAVMMQRVDVVSFAIDEAHCVTEWGHSFRKDYARLGELRARFPAVPIMALTATATPRVKQAITLTLGLRRGNLRAIQTSFNRPNLHYSVLKKTGSLRDDLRAHLSARVLPAGAGSAIVYCPTKRETEAVAEVLRRELGVGARAYHADMSDAARRDVHSLFLSGALQCVVATVAFGMGIDKVPAHCSTVLPGPATDHGGLEHGASMLAVPRYCSPPAAPAAPAAPVVVLVGRSSSNH